MKNALKKNTLLSSFLIVIVIAIITFTIMLVYETNQRNKLFEDYLQLEQQIVLDDVYSQYLQTVDSNHRCLVLENQLKSQFETSNILLKKLKSINKTGIVSSENKIKYTYILTNIKLWLHYKELQNNCDYDSDLVIYFYPETNTLSDYDKAISDARAKIFELELNTMNNTNNLGVLALPYQKNIPILDQIIADYSIIDSPAIIYNEKVYYDLNVLKN